MEETTSVSPACSAVSGHHAGLLCARNHRPQDSEWTEETGDGRKSDGRRIFLSFGFIPITVGLVTHIGYKKRYRRLILVRVWSRPVGREAAGGVHVLQRACRRKGHHAAHSNGGASQHAAGPRRGGQDGVPEGEDRTGVQ